MSSYPILLSDQMPYEANRQIAIENSVSKDFRVAGEAWSTHMDHDSVGVAVSYNTKIYRDANRK